MSFGIAVSALLAVAFEDNLYNEIKYEVILLEKVKRLMANFVGKTSLVARGFGLSARRSANAAEAPAEIEM